MIITFTISPTKIGHTGFVSNSKIIRTFILSVLLKGLSCMRPGPLSSVFLLIAFPLYGQSTPPASAPATKPMTRNVWWSQASMVMKIIDRAPEFGVDSLIIENNIEDVGWGEIIGGLAMYDYSKCCRREGEARTKVERVRKVYSEMIAAA